jgi:hypothetical protein
MSKVEESKIHSRPGDEIHYREYKIILQPQHFATAQGFRDFWEIVKTTAAKFKVKVEEAPDAFTNHVREVLFYDTDNFLLYRNHFIVRLRTFYKEGWPLGIPEFTVKFRHPSFEAAAAVDVHPSTPGGISRIKFKEELLPLRESLGGIRSIFSHNCVLAMPREQLNLVARDLINSFPSIGAVGAAEEAKITLVNDFAVSEVQANVGELHFHHGYNGKTTIAVWRDRKHEKPICGEFAFQCKFDKSSDLSKDSLKRADDFYKTLQADAFDWVSLGTTKTALVYNWGQSGQAHSE